MCVSLFRSRVVVYFRMILSWGVYLSSNTGLVMYSFSTFVTIFSGIVTSNFSHCVNRFNPFCFDLVGFPIYGKFIGRVLITQPQFWALILLFWVTWYMARSSYKVVSAICDESCLIQKVFCCRFTLLCILVFTNPMFVLAIRLILLALAIGCFIEDRNFELFVTRVLGLLCFVVVSELLIMKFRFCFLIALVMSAVLLINEGVYLGRTKSIDIVHATVRHVLKLIVHYCTYFMIVVIYPYFVGWSMEVQVRISYAFGAVKAQIVIISVFLFLVSLIWERINLYFCFAFFIYINFFVIMIHHNNNSYRRNLFSFSRNLENFSQLRICWDGGRYVILHDDYWTVRNKK